ncbi:MAG: NmrA family NAD(P)-binding protein, partial [Gemmatimonadales bacterium]
VSVLGAGTGIPMQLATWHTEVEDLVDAAGIPAVHLRASSFMQNFLASAGLIRATGQLFGTSGDGKITFVDTRDVAAAGVGALTRSEHQDEKVDIGGPAALSLDEVAASFTAVLGRPVAHVDLPGEAMKAGMIGAGLPEWLAADLVSYHGMARGRVMPVSDGVPRLAGSPARSFEDFIRDHRAAFA